MHPRAAEFAERARERYGLEIEVHEFEEGTETAADAADAVGCDVAQIASSIVMAADGASAAPGSRSDGRSETSRASEGADPGRAGDADGALVVVVTSGANRVDERRVAEALDAEAVRMADPDRIRETLGWSIGGVPPICHESDVPVLFDESLSAFEVVWAAAGAPDAVFPIDPASLVELADATPCPVTD